jgi:hypothetical protein
MLVKKQNPGNKPKEKTGQKGQAAPRPPIGQAEDSAADVTLRSKSKGEE